MQGGKEEKCIPFRYTVSSPWGDDKKSPWIDYMKGGRTGQNLEVEILLPESVASKLQKMMIVDPGIVREIVDYYMRKKLMELFNGDPWEGKKPDDKDIDSKKANYDYENNNPLCPPWKKWDNEEGGGRIYIPADPDVIGWQDEYVRYIKKIIF